MYYENEENTKINIMSEERAREIRPEFYRKNNLFYRKMERSCNIPNKEEDFSKPEYSLFMNVNPNTPISKIIHSIFNYESGDVYAWPSDNMSEEEFEKLWALGQRSFTFLQGCHETILYDIKFMSRDEWHKMLNEEKEIKINEIKKEAEELATNITDEYSISEVANNDNSNFVYQDKLVKLIEKSIISYRKI